jgi:hypothetical protein
VYAERYRVDSIAQSNSLALFEPYMSFTLKIFTTLFMAMFVRTIGAMFLFATFILAAGKLVFVRHQWA